ncbi:MAG TPA: sulfotransferase, partial [Sphingomicrobium sp.]|nr:sulfotransferase [Sphingomicrobium sp.]
MRAGDVAEAQRVLRERLASAPDDANAMAKLAEIVISLNNIEQATVLLRRASVASPSPARRLALVQHLQHHVGPAAALQEIEELPAELRSSFDSRAMEAAACGALGQHDRQIAVYRDMARDFPNNAPVWMSLGNALKTVGLLDEAVDALRRAIGARPTYGEAYWTLANFKSFRFTAADISAMRKALRGKLDDSDALHFHFALGKAFEDRNDYRASFRHYAEGNAIRARSLAPAQMSITPMIANCARLFRPETFRRHSGGGCRDRDPIFVVGLQRSGSTLVEQILASHPQIEGTTELTVIQQIWDRLARRAAAAGRDVFAEIALLPTGAFADIGAEYLERTRPFRLTDRPYFIDKQPANWMHSGLIRLALPNAKIVDARRHPMACGFSNFKQHYATGVTFSYSLEAIGHFYRDYWRFMNHIDA